MVDGSAEAYSAEKYGKASYNMVCCSKYDNNFAF